MTEHIHKLRRHKYKNGTVVYFCSMDCHFKIERELAIGKRTLCNICGEPFFMNEYSVKLAKPHCTNCGKMRIKNDDGTVQFVDRNRTKVIAEEMAANSVNSLRERLSSVVQMEPKDEDI